MNFEFKSTFKISKPASPVVQSVLIWLCTNLIASLFHWMNETTGHSIDKIILISLTFSLPAMVLLIPNLYFLNTFISRKYKIPYGFLTILLLCSIVVMMFLKVLSGFPVERHTIVLLVAPYCLAAQISFFIITRKMITA
jgi:hypothetical protein